MNAYEYAMEVEKEGEKYYRELANMSPYVGLKRVFTLLADEEVNHYEIFKDMLNKNKVDLSHLRIIEDKKTIYEELSKDKDRINFNSKEIKFYQDAIHAEDGLEQFYLKQAQKAETQDAKSVFIKISKEEAKHKIILENILSFIQEPNNLVECAEF